MTRTLVRKSMLVGLLALGLLATACSPQATPVASDEPTAPASVAPSETAAPTASAEESTIVVPSDEPAESELPEAEGIALADVDVELLKGAYENYGFVFGDVVTDEDGTTYYSGDQASEDVRVVIVFDGEQLTQVNLYDFSAGDGLDDMGYTIGLFAPEAQSWLVEQTETALTDEGTPLSATETFEHVSLTVNAFTDDSQSLDLIVHD